MSWVLYMIGFLILIAVWDVDSKVKKLLRAQNMSGAGADAPDGSESFDLEALKGRKVKIIVNEDCDWAETLDFMAVSAVPGEIIEYDDTWVVFRYTGGKYEKVPESTGTDAALKLVPVKGAEITRYIRISDIESIDEVKDED